MTQRTVHRLAQAVAIVAFDTQLGSLHIIVSGLENERNLIERSCCCKLVNHREIELDVVISLITHSTATLIEHHLTITLNIHKMGMRTGDNCRSLVFTGMTDDFDIEFIHITLLQFDVDIRILDILFALLKSVGSEVFQHFQLIFRLSDERTQRYGDRQTDHTRARNADTHRILEHIRTQKNFDTFRALAQCSSSLGCT